MQRCEPLPNIPIGMYTQLCFTLGFKVRLGPVQWGPSVFQGRLVEEMVRNPALPSHPSKDCCNICNPNSSCVLCKNKIKVDGFARLQFGQV